MLEGLPKLVYRKGFMASATCQACFHCRLGNPGGTGVCVAQEELLCHCPTCLWKDGGGGIVVQVDT